jgi:hypothetical protein
MKIELNSFRMGKTTEYQTYIGRQVIHLCLQDGGEFIVSGPKGAFLVKVEKLKRKARPADRPQEF